jgi:hypothetical protein
MTESLFPELDFTRENVIVWAQEEVAKKPILTVRGQRLSDPCREVENTTERVIREALDNHYLRRFCQYDKSDLIEELMECVKEGIDKPTATMSESELLDEIVQICTPSDDDSNTYEFETMDDFVRVFVNGEW